MTPRASLVFAAALASATAAFAQYTGPSSSASSYLTPTTSGWSSTSLLTVGDSVGGYKMVGIPDGLGAYDNGNGTITVLMSHELQPTAGVARAHGAKGAFVSEWTINKNTLAVTAGRDLATDVKTWNGSTWETPLTPYAIARLCSADLPSASAFHNTASGKGTTDRIFMSGEEAGNEGKVFGFVATGAEARTAYELPKLGKLSWENAVANPFSGDKTVVIGTDDTTPGQVYVYVGDKTDTGNAVERAGLANGTHSGIKVAGIAKENTSGTNTNGAVGTFTTEAIDTNLSGAAQQTAAASAGVTEFARPEDSAWVDANTFVFVTTGATVDDVTQSSKLYKVDFSDSTFTGGEVSLVLDSVDLTGKDGAIARKFDNLTVGEDGKVYIQEDPGNDAYIAKTWAVDLNNPAAAEQIFESDGARFLTPTAPFSLDEEHSGIIDVTSLFADASWYVEGTQVLLADTQAHYPNGGELVEGGQLSLLTNGTSPIPEPSTYAAIAGALGLVLAVVRRRASRR